MKNLNGSELHRVKPFTENSEERFEKLYKACRPLVKSLTSQINPRRYGVDSSIIQSYFWDKLMYVYNRYKDEYEDDQLKATILASLKTYKNKLLRSAYSQQSEFNQSCTSFEVLYEGNKEFIDDNEEAEYKDSKLLELRQYLLKNLTSEEYLLFQTELNPPPYLKEKMVESRGRISILHLIDFFELPRDKRSQQMITQMRNNIKNTLEIAKTQLHR